MKSEHEEIKISIGCGFKYDGSTKDITPMDYEVWKIAGKGYIGIDKGDYGQHIKRDIRRGLPFCDCSVDEIVADNVLEHIDHSDHFGEKDFIFVMNECQRVLKSGGMMKVIVPYWSDKSSAKDPTHARLFAEGTFQYFTNDNCWEYGLNKGWELKTVKRLLERNSILIVEMVKK
jgi:SAM-dependent methyltransferase